MHTIPFFKSTYSIGRSILTLNPLTPPDKKPKEKEADSILDICAQEKLSECFLVEDDVYGFIEANNNFAKAKIKLNLGLRMTMCDDLTQKEETTLVNNHKVIVLTRNSQGYYDLLPIRSKAATEGFYYEPRLDYKWLKKLWTKNLVLVVPFYDSFLYKNILTFSSIVPDCSFTEAHIAIEPHHHLPFNDTLLALVQEYSKKHGLPPLPTHSIYYKTMQDFESYLTLRAINRHGSFDKPELEHMSDPTFCVESWKEANGKS